MSFTSLICSVSFISCHPAAGAHFTEFAEVLEKNKVPYEVLAAEKATDAFEKRKITYQNFAKEIQGDLKNLTDEQADELALTVAKKVSKSTYVLTDVGHPFIKKVYLALNTIAPHVKKIAYYDNSEAFVPGGYSETAAQIMKLADSILFANSNFAQNGEKILESPEKELKLEGIQRIGLGYFPLDEATVLRKARFSDAKVKGREAFLKEHNITNPKQILAVYSGGANSEYFTKAFPQFCEILRNSQKIQDLSSLTIIFQQHPRALQEGDPDGKLLRELAKADSKTAPQIVFSKLKTIDALTFCDLVMYYQTGMAATFALASIPTIQIAHEPYPDVLVRNGLCPSIQEAGTFCKTLNEITQNGGKEADNEALIFKGLGIRKNWDTILIETVTNKPHTTTITEEKKE
ncbi:MAG: hypothetical protein JWO53_725 [Chlamydiia bacterium]|nr:hypothetical protein [Chlamydiia bacterium]